MGDLNTMVVKDVAKGMADKIITPNLFVKNNILNNFYLIKKSNEKYI